MRKYWHYLSDSGILTQNSLPSLSSLITPYSNPCLSKILRTIASPSPEPTVDEYITNEEFGALSFVSVYMFIIQQKFSSVKWKLLIFYLFTEKT